MSAMGRSPRKSKSERAVLRLETGVFVAPGRVPGPVVSGAGLDHRVRVRHVLLVSQARELQGQDLAPEQAEREPHGSAQRLEVVKKSIDVGVDGVVANPVARGPHAVVDGRSGLRVGTQILSGPGGVPESLYKLVSRGLQ